METTTQNHHSVSTREKKKEYSLMEKFNFFHNKKSPINKKTPTLKEVLFISFFLFMGAQLIFVAQNRIRFNDFVNFEADHVNTQFSNWGQIKKELEAGKDTDFLIDYNNMIKNPSAITNLMGSSLTKLALANEKFQPATKEKVLSLWNDNKYTGINQNYQMQKSFLECLPIDMSCYFLNRIINFKEYSNLVKDKINGNDYDIHHFQQYQKASQDPVAYMTSDYYKAREKAVAQMHNQSQLSD
jgi:hypothetical protein